MQLAKIVPAVVLLLFIVTFQEHHMQQYTHHNKAKTLSPNFLDPGSVCDPGQKQAL